MKIQTDSQQPVATYRALAEGKLPQLSVFGNNYPTLDGTGMRDYIHVVDLAEGHLWVLEVLGSRSGAYVRILGTDQGYRVFEMVCAFKQMGGLNCRIE